MYTYPTREGTNPNIKVHCITPNEGRVIHRFFDTSPISPSGRYAALCRFPYEDKNGAIGDTAQIVLCDLMTGEEKVLYHTHGWEAQVGANVQWGVTDETLVFNDVTPGEWEPFMVKMNPLTGEANRMGCGVFMLSPDGSFALTHNMSNSRVTQYGYGVSVPKECIKYNDSHPTDDGFYMTDLRTGECRMIVSLAELLDATMDKATQADFEGGQFYGFQCKWNRQQTRLMLVVRCAFADGRARRNMVFTMKPDGSEIYLALPWQYWARGGHHVNWHPDGEHITMNLCMESKTLRFVKYRYDGTELHSMSDKLVGSGHPSIHIDGRYLITDAYVAEQHFNVNGTVPIRLIDLQTEKETVLTRVYTDSLDQPVIGDLRVDPHPAWDTEFKRIIFNGFDGGTRRVYVLEGWEGAL